MSDERNAPTTDSGASSAAASREAARLGPPARHGRHCSERIRQLEDELAGVRREFEEAGLDYMRDVQAHEREEARLKKLLTEAGISWNPS